MPPKRTPPKAKSVQYATGADKVGSCKDEANPMCLESNSKSVQKTKRRYLGSLKS